MVPLMGTCYVMLRKIRHLREDPGRGISLAELLVVVVIIGILSSVVIGVSISTLRRERVNSVALAFAGWIEDVRNLASKRVDIDASSSADDGCEIVLNLPLTNAVAGAKLASVDATCSTDAPAFEIDSQNSGVFSVVSSNGNSIIFTPRGSWVASPSVSGDLVIKILLNGTGPMRCVKISETLGSVSLGKSSTNSTSAECNDYTRI